MRCSLGRLTFEHLDLAPLRWGMLQVLPLLSLFEQVCVSAPCLCPLVQLRWGACCPTRRGRVRGWSQRSLEKWGGSIEGGWRSMGA